MDRWLWSEGLFVQKLHEVLHFWESLTLILKETACCTSLQTRKTAQLGAEVREVWGGWSVQGKICGFTKSRAARSALSAWCTRFVSLQLASVFSSLLAELVAQGGLSWARLCYWMLCQECAQVWCVLRLSAAPLQLSLGLLWVPRRHWHDVPLLYWVDPTSLDTNVLQILARLSFLSEYLTRKASDKMGAACFRWLHGFAKCFQASQLLFSWQLFWSFLYLFCGKWKITAHGCIWRKIFLLKTLFLYCFKDAQMTDCMKKPGSTL